MSLNPVAVQAVDAARRTHPQRAVLILGQRRDGVGRETFLAGHYVKALAVEACQARAQCTDPDLSRTVLQQGSGFVAGKAFIHGVRHPASAKKLVKAVFSPDP